MCNKNKLLYLAYIENIVAGNADVGGWRQEKMQ